MEVPPTKEELERIEDSNRLRRELLPATLIERVGFRVDSCQIEVSVTDPLPDAMGWYSWDGLGFSNAYLVACAFTSRLCLTTILSLAFGMLRFTNSKILQKQSTQIFSSLNGL